MGHGIDALEGLVDCGRVTDVTVNESHALGDARLVSEVHLGFETVEHDHVVTPADEALDEVGPDESRTPSDQDSPGHDAACP
jgi:hypothetical protein